MNPLFALIRTMLLRMSRAAALGRLVQRTAWGRRAVRRFVAGDTIPVAVEVALDLKRRGFTVTLDRLGEASTGVSADAYAADASELLTAQAAAGLEPNVSVKLTALGLSEGDAVAAARLDRILATAQGVNGFVRVDAEYANSLDQMHEIVAAARAAGRPVGAVVQANMQRSAADLTRLIAGGIPVRLVKGAYDPGAEGVGDIEAVNAAYLALAERLIATNLPIAFGTHDDRIISKLSASAQSRGEIQLLYGVRTELAEQLVAKGWRVRIYTPYGPDWWPYSLRRMAERPANLRFVLRSLVGR
ncbi:MAG: proline dehydrogenase family protein [Chloroflexi bacterium]|nr:proline dehydrogenase family protein [Chloroflexota bacterium]MBJ7360382.1 proline dehydrogenase family protein [Chloroflexota bacterium]MBJ7482770.1 proline dehydrogenase family protein [Chloroflexota bacterium]